MALITQLKILFMKMAFQVNVDHSDLDLVFCAIVTVFNLLLCKVLVL